MLNNALARTLEASRENGYDETPGREPRAGEPSDGTADEACMMFFAEKGASLAKVAMPDASAEILSGYISRLADGLERFAAFGRQANDRPAGPPVDPKILEWLSDNEDLILEAFHEAKAGISAFNEIRKVLTRNDLAVIDVVASHVELAQRKVDPQNLLAMIDGFRQMRSISTRALCQMPFLCRLVLIDRLRIFLEKLSAPRALASAGDVGESHAASVLPFARPDEDDGRASDGAREIGNIVSGLRIVGTTDWAVWVGKASAIDRMLGGWPDFNILDGETRLRYRQAFEDLSLKLGLTEEETVERALRYVQSALRSGDRQADIGHFLIGGRRAELARALGLKKTGMLPKTEFLRSLAWLAIPAGVVALTLALLGVMALVVPHGAMPHAAMLLMLVLASLPASEGAFALVTGAISMLVRPERLPGYDYSGEVPEEARTMVVVPSLLIDRRNVDELVGNLELHYLANRAENVHFALLTDWTDAQAEQEENDRKILDYARERIGLLSRKYGMEGQDRFLLLHRGRLFNPAEGVWMGWERKRGKLRELNGLLRNAPDTSFLPGYDRVPASVRYVVTLDSDTRTTPGSIVRLIGKIHHPLNRPVMDKATGRLISGHAILQPRVGASFGNARKISLFQKIYSAGRGLDPYVFTVSDIYQDLAHAGTFTGKGIYDVDAFEAALGSSICENTILSHDLLEGDLARSAFVSDVEFVEDFPLQYQVDFSRHHRWIRGDWQLLGWLVTPRNGLTRLGRWKIFDNLRRSLVPVGWIGAAIVSWPFVNTGTAFLLFLGLSAFLFAGSLVSLAHVAAGKQEEFTRASYFRHLGRETAATLGFAGLRLTFLGHGAIGALDAISRALYRSWVSGRKMLEWRSFAESGSRHSDRLAAAFRSMWTAPALSGALALISAISGTVLPLPAYALLILWAMSPMVAWFSGRCRNEAGAGDIPADMQHQLGATARHTWRFFSEFVNVATNHLPPDNFQEKPSGVLAERTSPTNIGVYLLAALSAREFGWIGTRETISRLGATLSTIEGLPKYRGHLLNWYRTDTLEALSPRYVSSVDSGNLAGHLIAIAAACEELARAGTGSSDRFVGLRHTVGVIRQVLEQDQTRNRHAARELPTLLARFSLTLERGRGEDEAFVIDRLVAIATKIDRLATKQFKFAQGTGGSDIRYWTKALRETCLDICQEHFASHAERASWKRAFGELAARARDMAMAMDFSFLMQADRQLMSIGFNVENGKLDEPCYDLLASEARLASFFAIAKGDLPVSHWQKLGRPTTEVGREATLVSWSGSMFEYLMPVLVMWEPKDSILGRTAIKAIEAHAEYAREAGRPWGISEAAYNHRDENGTYRYSGFGAPSLGLKRGLDEDFVVAPYASALASQIVPEAAAANLQALGTLGARGRFGYCEAVDFTPGRTGPNGTPSVVWNYMAHHQGMSIAAIANTLLEGRLRDWFHSDPLIRSVELLLHERAPRMAPAKVKADLSEESDAVKRPHAVAYPGLVSSLGGLSGLLAGGRSIAARSIRAMERHELTGAGMPAEAEAAE